MGLDCRPASPSIEVLQLIDARWTLVDTYSESDVVAAEPFPLAEIDLPLMWGTMPPEE
jgi:hypothetical protein